MFKPRGKHARKRTRCVGPLFALDMLLAQLMALREASAVYRCSA